MNRWADTIIDWLIAIAVAFCFGVLVFFGCGCSSAPRYEPQAANGFSREQVQSSCSMVPSIQPSSWVQLDHDYAYDDLRPGMVVVYRADDGERIIHRLKVRLGNGSWIVQGDNNPYPDAEYVTRANFESVCVGFGRGVFNNRESTE